MSFRSIKFQLRTFVILTGISIFGLPGCGLRIGEKAPEGKPIQIGSAGCFSHMSERIGDFLEARLSDQGLQEFMGCVRYSFESFGKHTRGLDRDSFSPIEIRDFLHEYFVREKVIPDSLLQDFMILKQALVGGPLDKVTRRDLSEVVSTLSFLENQMLQLNPYMALYNFKTNWKTFGADTRPERVNAAIVQLRSFAASLGDRLVRANSAYSIKSLESLIRDFRDFAGWEEVFVNSRSPERWSEFLASFKSVTTGLDQDLIRPEDWRTLFSSMASWYGITVKMRAAAGFPSILRGEGLEFVVKIADDLSREMKSTVDAQATGVVSFDQINRLLDSLERAHLLPTLPGAGGDAGDENSIRRVKAQGLKKALYALFNRTFGDRQIPWDQRKSKGLSRLTISQMETEFSRWSEIQHYLDRVFQGAGADRETVRLKTLSDALSPLGASDRLAGLMTDGSGSADMGQSVARLMEQNLRPFFKPNDQVIFLADREELAKNGVVHGFYNLSVMNVLRATTSLLMRGYSSYFPNEFGSEAGLKADELQAFYLDYRDFGVDMRFFDPRSASAGYRAFREANMFTYSGNGLQKESKQNQLVSRMNFFETMEFITFVYSGGQVGRSVFGKLMDSEIGLCYSQSRNTPISVHGYPMINRRCFEENVLKAMSSELEHLPGLMRELRGVTPVEQLDLARRLTAMVASTEAGHQDLIEWHDLTTLAVILSYTEALMTRFNQDRNPNLNTSEVWQAYDIFKVYLDQAVAKKCEETMKWLKTPEGAVEWFKILAGNSGALPAEVAKSELKAAMLNGGCEHLPDFVTAGVFAFLITHGRAPNSLLEVNYVPKWPFVGEEFDLNRVGLLKVFAALVDAERKSSKGNVSKGVVAEKPAAPNPAPGPAKK